MTNEEKNLMCIKFLYPDIQDKDFSFYSTIAEGDTSHIARWSSVYLRPTQAQIEAVYPQVLKEQKLVKLKSTCKIVAYKNHDIDDKIEALAGLKTAQEIVEIKNWIKAVKYVFGQVKAQINNALDVVSIEAVDISYATILGQVEAYYLIL